MRDVKGVARMASVEFIYLFRAKHNNMGVEPPRPRIYSSIGRLSEGGNNGITTVFGIFRAFHFI